MKYLLDTNMVSFAIRGVGSVGDRLRETEPAEVLVSAVSEAELWFGVRKSGSRKLERAVVGFLDAVTIIGFDRTAARSYGTLRALLETRGTPIGIADTMIAAQALAGPIYRPERGQPACRMRERDDRSAAPILL